MGVIKEESIRFYPDGGLMYLIQQVTKQPTDEILGFFFDFGKAVLAEGIDHMKHKQRSIRKDIEALYPGTAIPFKLLCEARKQWNGNTDAMGDFTINVQFPSNYNYINTEKMITTIMERQLLGGASLPDFEPPRSKTPKLYKDLIKKVLKGSDDGTTV